MTGSLPAPIPARCQAQTVDGQRCREWRGTVHCAYYARWLCARHHADRLQTWGSREEHRARDAEEAARLTPANR